MSKHVEETLYNWVTGYGMNSVEDCLELLDDPVTVNRELEYALGQKTSWNFGDHSAYECMEILQTQVRNRLTEEVTEAL